MSAGTCAGRLPSAQTMESSSLVRVAEENAPREAHGGTSASGVKRTMARWSGKRESSKERREALIQRARRPTAEHGSLRFILAVNSELLMFSRKASAVK